MVVALAQFEISLLTIAPVHIGNGIEMSKKEYICENGRYYFPNLYKLYTCLSSKRGNLLEKYDDQVINNSRMDLQSFLQDNYISERNFGGYSIPVTDVDNKKGNVKQFIRDAYQQPYIPGSSLKGALRTVISYQNKWLNDFGGQIRIGSSTYNDFYSKIRVSDSLPLKNDQLLICTKYTWSQQKGGHPKALNLYREAIKPLTKITFSLTVEGEKQIQEIRRLQKLCGQHYKDYFNYFLRELDASQYIQNIGNCPYIYIGAGSGFWTKVFLEKGDPSRHQMRKPNQRNVPVMKGKGALKLTKAPIKRVKQGSLVKNAEGFYEMGKCLLFVKERN